MSYRKMPSTQTCAVQEITRTQNAVDRRRSERLAKNTGAKEIEMPEDGARRLYPLLKFPEEMRVHGYARYDLGGPAEGDLDNELHPIFHRRNFICGAADSPLWEALQPSLRLATKFLTERNVMAHWIHLMCGKLTILHPHDNHPHWYLAATSKELHAFFETNLEKVQAKLCDLASRIHFLFADLNRFDRDREYRPYAVMTTGSKAINDLCTEDISFPDYYGPKLPLYICINTHFKTYLLQQTRTPYEDLRSHWFLAVTIIHELTHAFWRSMHEIPHHHEPWVTKFTDTGRYPELGTEWEMDTFGGVLSGFMDPTHGVIGMDAKLLLSRGDPPGAWSPCYLVYPIPYPYLHKFFHKSFWERVAGMTQKDMKKDSPFKFRPPPHGVVFCQNEWVWAEEGEKRDRRRDLAFWRSFEERRLQHASEAAEAAPVRWGELVRRKWVDARKVKEKDHEWY